MSFVTERQRARQLWATIQRWWAVFLVAIRDVWKFLRPQSLRGRLIFLTSSLVVFLFAMLSLITYIAQSRTLQDNAQQTLNREVAIVRSSLEHQVFGNPPIWPNVIRVSGLNPIADPGLTIEIHDATGQLRYTTDIEGQNELLPVPPAADAAALNGTATTLSKTVSGERTLIAVVPLDNDRGQIVGVAHIARSLQEVDAALGNLRFLMILANGAALVIAIIGGWYVTRRVLSPLTEIARVANEITQTLGKHSSQTPAALSLRVPPVDDAGELGALVTDVNRMLDALARYDERQRQFIADASHELRTPLTTIRGNLELVRRKRSLPSAEREEALNDAATESERMAMLVNDLLMLARAESSGDARQRYVPIEIDTILLEVFRMARERQQAQRLTDLTVKLQGLAPAQILGDPLQLRQILLILVDNALKYAPHGTITLAMALTPEMVVLSVADQGPGIRADDLPHIFDRLYRANRERNREGSGLGLAIARTLVDQHGGVIAATSVPDQGATFTITLPRLPLIAPIASDEPIPTPIEAGIGGAPPGATDTVDGMRPWRADHFAEGSR